MKKHTLSFHGIEEFLVFLLLFLLKNILQKTQLEKTAKEHSCNFFEPNDSESSTGTDSTNESDE